ncbi:hypothetical protein ACFSJ3_15195 [Corallincola platygyrae]|uniref:Uncharacterized protein n=1 Tax=Corallincola platygyrae TaxID=1193278 RepID=A0ABW4XP56_9GAMM
MRFFLLVITFLTATLGLQAQATDWPTFPVPDNAQVTIIAQEIRNNGLPLHILELRTDKTMAEVMSFYRQEWTNNTGDVEGFIEQELNGAPLISHYDPSEQMMFAVQLNKVQGITIGTLSISYMGIFEDESDFSPGKGLPVPARSVVIQDFTAAEMVGSSRTATIRTKQSIAMAKEFYLKHYMNRGWQNISYRMKDSRSKGILLFSRNGNEVQLIFSRPKGSDVTDIVMVQVNKGSGLK